MQGDIGVAKRRFQLLARDHAMKFLVWTSGLGRLCRENRELQMEQERGGEEYLEGPHVRNRRAERFIHSWISAASLTLAKWSGNL